MISKHEPYVLVMGVSICDIFGFTNKSYKTHESNPGSIKVSFGGVCRNIAENMVRVGVNTKFISVLGDDERGKNMLEHAKKINLDMSESLILKGKNTPTYMAILDENGEMVSAVVDMETADSITEEFVDSKSEIIKNSTYTIIGADYPETVEYLVKNYKDKTDFILDPVSLTKAKALKHVLHYFHTIKPNRYEAEALCGFKIKNNDDVRKAGKYFIDLGIKNVFISLDADGIYYNNGEEEGVIKSEGVSVVNVTGAGDSLVAGIGYGYANKMNIKDTVKFAIAMSVITIAHEDTIHPEMGLELVEEYIKNIKWTENIYL